MLDAKTFTTDMLTVPLRTCGANNDKTLFTDSHKAILETLSSPHFSCSENLGMNISKMVTTLFDLVTPSAHKARHLSFSSTETSKVRELEHCYPKQYKMQNDTTAKVDHYCCPSNQ
jgi:hypothetical protein